MNELSLATLLSHPFGQIVVTVIVAAITSMLTVRMMSPRGDNREAPPRTAAVAAASPAPRDYTWCCPSAGRLPVLLAMP